MPLSRRHFLASVSLVAITPLLVSRVGAQSMPIYAEGGVAVDGSDVVAYFTDARPTPGRAEFTHNWRGATWRFANAANRDAFAADPERYAPQYGGFCAYAVSEGYTASTTPEAWKIVDGKLYLNYSRRIQRRWERDIPARIAAADANWPGVLN